MICLNLLFILLNIAYDIIIEIKQFLFSEQVLKHALEDHIELQEVFIVLWTSKVSFENERCQVDKPE